jgi:hypothetical protein
MWDFADIVSDSSSLIIIYDVQLKDEEMCVHEFDGLLVWVEPCDLPPTVGAEFATDAAAADYTVRVSDSDDDIIKVCGDILMRYIYEARVDDLCIVKHPSPPPRTSPLQARRRSLRPFSYVPTWLCCRRLEK